jgi:hypothetical protein
MNVLKQPMNSRQAKASNLYLKKDEYLQGDVDWLIKDAEVWDSLCEYWASPAFIAKFERARQNRLSKRSVHHYGANEHARKVLVQMNTPGKSKERYDTDTLVLCIIVYTFVYNNVRFCIVEGQYEG